MTINEKVAYLKGFIEGLGFKPETPEQKIIASMVDILDDLAKTVTDVEDDVEYALDYIEELDSDLGDVESYVFADDDEYFDEDDYYDDDEEYYDDDEDEEYDSDDEDEEVYEFECPECGEKIYFSNELVDKDEVICPSCHAKLTFDADEEDE